MKNQKKISRNFLFVLTFIGTVVAYKATDLLIQVDMIIKFILCMRSKC